LEELLTKLRTEKAASACNNNFHVRWGAEFTCADVWSRRYSFLDRVARKFFYRFLRGLT
jgi:hypothetical protein